VVDGAGPIAGDVAADSEQTRQGAGDPGRIPGVPAVERAHEVHVSVRVPAHVDIVPVRRRGKGVDVDELLVVEAGAGELPARIGARLGGEIVPCAAAVTGSVEPDGARLAEGGGVGRGAVGRPGDGRITAGVAQRQRCGLGPGGTAVRRVVHALNRPRAVGARDCQVRIGGVDGDGRLRTPIRKGDASLANEWCRRRIGS